MDEKKIARAEHKYARISPRKVEIICNMIRGKDAKYAMALMENTPKAGCELMIKVLKSAMANAENNLELDPSSLYVAEIYANQGPTLKRYRIASRSMVHPYVHRTSHLTVVLDQIGARGFNMECIKSRPLPHVPFEYYFYVQLVCPAGCDAAACNSLLETLTGACSTLRLLGAFTLDGIDQQ